MNRTTAPILLFLALGTAARAQTDVEVKIQLPTGDKWTVAQTIEVKSDMVDAKGKSEGKVAECPEIRLIETWVDEALADDAGRPAKIQRTVTSSQLGDASTKPAATAMEGAVLTIEREGSKVEAAKGTPDEKSLDILRRATPEAIEILLPEKPVKAGATWEIKQADVVRFLNAIGASIVSVRGKSAGPVKERFENRMAAEGRSFAEGVDLKATVATAGKGEISIRFEGRRELIGKSSTSVNGKEKPAPRGFVEFGGVLKFNTATGKPVQFDLTISQLEYDGTSVTMSGGDLNMNGVRDVWKIRRAWAKAK